MILQRNIMEKCIHKSSVSHLTVRRKFEFGNFNFYSRGGEVKEEKNKKNIFWGFVLLGRYSLGRGCPIEVIPKCKTSKIFTFHDETVTLTFNLTQLFYFQNISFLFSANKSKHTISNLKYLKWQKVGRGHLIFIFRGEFPMKVIRGMLIPIYTL